MRRPKLSICMIVKDEEKNLRQCLDSLLPIIHRKWCELIIVDTGSKDKTCEIALEYVHQVFSFEWNNNFSDARNYSISKANGERLLIVDADEKLESSSLSHLESYVLNPKYSKYTAFLKIQNYYTPDLSRYTDIMQARIFENTGKFHYEGTVHNKPKIEKPFRYYFAENIVFKHYGYLFEDNRKLLEQKRDRSLPILLKEYKNKPDDFHILTHLLKTFYMLRDWDNVIEYGKSWIKMFAEIKFTKGWYAYIEGFLNILGAYLETGNTAGAERIRTEVEKYSKRVINVYIMLGYYYSDIEPGKTFQYFEHALKLYHRKGSVYEKLLTNNNDILIAKVLNYLANMHFREGNYEKAGEYLQEGIELNENRLPLRWDIWNEEIASKRLKRNNVIGELTRLG